MDCVIYDEIKDASEIELEKKSDYASKEFLTPLSETLLYFTEEEVNDEKTLGACVRANGDGDMLYKYSLYARAETYS